MIIRKNVVLIAAAVLIFAGCLRETAEPSVLQDTDAIGFSAYTGTAVTKGVAVGSGEVYGSASKGIGVFAFYQPATSGSQVYFNTSKFTTPDFMCNQQVSSVDGDTWSYSPIKYWPNNSGDLLSFFAYAPYEEGTTWDDLRITTDATASKITASFTIYNEKAAMQDILWADPQINKTKASTVTGGINNPVTFNFKHILSRVAVYVGVEQNTATGSPTAWDDGNTTITIDKVEFTDLADAYNYSCPITSGSMGTAVWKAGSTTQDIVLSRDGGDFNNDNAVIDNQEPWTTPGYHNLLAEETGSSAFLFLAPQDFTDDNEKIIITYTVKTTASDKANGSTITNTVPTDLYDFLPAGFESGKAYNLNFLIGMNSVNITASVKDWAEPATHRIDVPLSDATAATSVYDIDGANKFVSENRTAKDLSVIFSREPNDSGIPGEDEGAHALLTTLLSENSVLNVTVETDTKTLYVGDYPDQNTITKLTDEETYAAVVNLTIPSEKKIGTLIINAPSKSVHLNGRKVTNVGTLSDVEATTSAYTLVVEQGQKIGTLKVHQGGLEIHENISSDVNALVIDEDAHDSNPVKVRACEHLSQSVFDVIYKVTDGTVEHDYIDRPYWVEKRNTTVTSDWDIVESVCMIVETDRGYATLADAFAAVEPDQNILLLKDCEINDRIDVTCNVTLDCDKYSVTNNVSSDRCLCVNGCDFTIVADGGSFIIPESNTTSYGFVKVPDNCGNTSITIEGLTMSGTTDDAALIKTGQSTNDIAITLKDVEATASDWIVYSDDTYGKIIWDIEGGNFTSENICFSIADWCTDDVCMAKFKGVTAVADFGPVIELSYTPGEFSDCNFTVTNLKQEPNEWYSVAIAVSNGAVATINSGTYTSEKCNALEVYTTGGTFNINGGTFTGSENALFADVDTSQYPTADATINVYGGQINGNMTTGSSPCYINLYGGIYSVEPSTTDAKPGFGYAQAANDDTSTSSAYPWKVVANPAEDAEVSIAKTGMTTVYVTMEQFRDYVNAGNNHAGYTVTVLKDIALTDWSPIGSCADNKVFSGTFDGDGKTITLKKSNISDEKYGLFAYFKGTSENPVVVKNLNLAVTLSTDGTTQTRIGGLAALAEYAQFTGITVTGSIVAGHQAGGLIGWAASDASFTDCTNKASVNVTLPASTGYSIFGGITAQAYGTVSFTNCRNEGSLTADHTYASTADSYIGHIAGKGPYPNEGGSITMTSCTFDSNAIITGWNVLATDMNTYPFEGVISGQSRSTYFEQSNPDKLLIGGYFNRCTISGVETSWQYPNGVAHIQMTATAYLSDDVASRGFYYSESSTYYKSLYDKKQFDSKANYSEQFKSGEYTCYVPMTEMASTIGTFGDGFNNSLSWVGGTPAASSWADYKAALSSYTFTTDANSDACWTISDAKKVHIYGTKINDSLGKITIKTMSITTGTAKATVGGQEVDISWVQLWEGGPKWSTINIGATSPTGCGQYFAWGYTEGCVRNASDDGWVLASDGVTVKQFNATYFPNKKFDDAATAIWGAGWSVPTKADFTNLISNTTIEYVKSGSAHWSTYQVKGILITGKNDYSSNSIFLPAAGNGVNDELQEIGSGYGRYWSESSDFKGGNYLFFSLVDYNEGTDVKVQNKWYGNTIRPVYSSSK